MGYELRITRQRFGKPIPLDEWLAEIDADGELARDPDNDDGAALWRRPGDHGDEPGLLYWIDGEVCSKHPDDALVEKMIAVANRLGALVVGDDGELYPLDPDAEPISPNSRWLDALMTPTGAMVLALAGAASVVGAVVWDELDPPKRPPVLAAILLVAGVPVALFGAIFGGLNLAFTREGRTRSTIAVATAAALFLWIWLNSSPD